MNLVERAKNIIVTPKTEWEAVAAEEPNIQQILLGYVLPLALISNYCNNNWLGIYWVFLDLHHLLIGIAMGLVTIITCFTIRVLAGFHS